MLLNVEDENDLKTYLFSVYYLLRNDSIVIDSDDVVLNHWIDN